MAQTDALATYNQAVSEFKSILAQRRAQISARQGLPDLPGQALYLARNKMMSAYKDLTDEVPSRIGRPNKFKIPPAYFDADTEPLLDEYYALFDLMDAPPPTRRNPIRRSRTPPISEPRLRGRKASMRQARRRPGASASASSLPKPAASRTSAMPAPTNTRAVSRPAPPRTRTAAGNGPRSGARSPPSIRR
jgi:hypothetical protein